MLIHRYNSIFSDLDGVVYEGDRLLPHVRSTVNRLNANQIPIFYLTNNASKNEEEIATKLTKLGLRIDQDQVVTSSEAGVILLAQRLPEKARVFVVGTKSLQEKVRQQGFNVINSQMYEGTSTTAQPLDVDAVIQGHNPDLTWSELAVASLCIESGAYWIATNTDLSIPIVGGVAPGNGSFVQALENATHTNPVVAGKPQKPLFDVAKEKAEFFLKSTTSQEDSDQVEQDVPLSALMIGDRLDTDIEGANLAGVSSALVLTGISQINDVYVAPKKQRPDYILENIEGLFEPYPSIRIEANKAEVYYNKKKNDQAGAYFSAEEDVILKNDSLDSKRAACFLYWKKQDKK